jgi:peptide/nickel transport system permease protein
VRALLRLVLSRLLQGALLLLALSFVLFALLAHLPGDPFDALVAADPTVSAAEVARQKQLRGLDRPFFVQWWRWLVGHEVPVSVPPDVEAPALVGRLGVDREGMKAPAFVVDVARPTPPPGTRLSPIAPLVEDGERWRATLHEPGASRVFARVTGVDDRFGGQEGLWSMPVLVAPALVDGADDLRPADELRAAAIAVRAPSPIARVSIPRLIGQHVAADDGDVYIVDGTPLSGRFRCGAICFFSGDRDALGWSWASKRPVSELLLGPDDPACGDGTRDPGEGCDDGNGATGDGCDAFCVVEGASVVDRLDVAVAGALVTMGRIGNTLWLTVPALLLSLATALFAGTWAGLRGGRVDAVVRLGASLASSAPTFVVALVLIAVVAVRWRLLPTGGLSTPGIHEQGAVAVVLDRVRHAALPTAVLWLAWSGRFTRAVHAAVVSVATADFVVAARARGLSARAVVLRHVLPHAVLPLLSLVGLSLPALAGGALLTETLFAWPGLGRLQFDSLGNGDAYVAVVVLLVHAALVVIGSLLADVGAWVLDPRLRRRGSSAEHA